MIEDKTEAEITAEEQESDIPEDERNPDEIEMSFLDHLEELRWSIIRSLIAGTVGVIIAFIFRDIFLQFLLYPSTQLIDPATELLRPLKLQALKVQSMFNVYLEIGFFGGLVLALPYILIEMWRFVRPALVKRERRYLLPLIFFATCLFIVGNWFAYSTILPLALQFFTDLAPSGVEGIVTQKIEPDIGIDSYISFVLRLMFIFGLIFELPVISYFLGKIGLISSDFMKKYRRHSIILIFVLAAIVTPPDPVTQIFLGIPVIFLYELSIYIVKWVEKKSAVESTV